LKTGMVGHIRTNHLPLGQSGIKEAPE